MVATSGGQLADDATVTAFEALMDVATIVTPNLPELKRLTMEEEPVAAALHLVGKHNCAVLIKGGHEAGDAIADALIEENSYQLAGPADRNDDRPCRPACSRRST